MVATFDSNIMYKFHYINTDEILNKIFFTLSYNIFFRL